MVPEKESQPRKSNKTGYDSTVVLAFIKEHGERRPDGALISINGKRVLDHQRVMVARWETKPLVPLERIDNLLIHCGLLLFELEQWAERELGTTGWQEIAA